MKPICVKCHRFFRMVKSGFYFIEGMPLFPGTPPGLADCENWKPYKLWCGDKWECKGCGAVILSGFGSEPISEHFKADFKEMLDKLGARRFQVNDC